MNASTVPMESSKLVLLLSLLYILLFQPSLSAAQPNFSNYDCTSNNVRNYTTNSTYQRNLNSLLSSLASDTQIDYGFYNLSVGEFPDRVNAIALCRGDIAVDVCRSCVNNSTRKILEVCPNQMEAFGVYSLCMIRYSNRSIFGVVDKKPLVYMANGMSVLDATVFNQALQTLFARLRAKAASGNSLKKFASGNQSAGVETIYATVQCTPDLSEEQCSSCLLDVFRLIPNCCGGNVKGKIGAKLNYPSCNLSGYMAPEYAMQGHFSVKSDVFSFGVLVLEIVTGKKNSFRNGDDIEHLMSHAWRNWREGTAQNIIDPVLSNGSAAEMIRYIHIGLLCVQENIADRPTMASVVLMLSSSSLTLQIPSQPAFFMTSHTYQSNMLSSLGLSESEHISLSRNEVSISKLYPR
ncbi:hypothetical protein SADUNF_Sadunf11G0014800 [Salix dunnii]|uniref:Gnk2-homologous domain-containing protein n=1 Tax=Salix dunnii TaxID=1413687 RepID=A0A835JPH6_9ROSI|nr:hypothetical protein SADUNF_Sadunf11G0014800 [Salix dunnii]